MYLTPYLYLPDGSTFFAGQRRRHPRKPDYLSRSERRAFADLAGTSQPLMQVVPRTLLLLLAQVAAQEQQLLLHERREKGLRTSAETWIRHGDCEDEA